MVNQKYTKWWTTQDGKIHLMKRENNQKIIKTVDDFNFYFVISKEDFNKFNMTEWSMFMKRHKQYGLKFVPTDREWVKVYLNDNTNTNRSKKMKLIRDFQAMKVKVYEGDLTNAKRYAIDNNLQIADEYEYCFFDIETDDSNEGIVIGRDRILSFACVDKHKNVHFYCNDDEIELLKDIQRMMIKYDVLVGFNSRDFDLAYIRERMNHHNKLAGYKIFDYYTLMQQCIHVDFYHRLKKMFSGFLKIAFKLDSLGQFFLKRGKVKHGKSIKWLYDNDKDTLQEYNEEDCLLLYDLNEQLHVLGTMILQSQRCFCPLSKFWVGELLDNFYLRGAKARGIYLPTAFYQNNEKEKYEGAYVYDAQVGWYNNPNKKYGILDFSALYPSLIKTWNISIDVYDAIPKEGVDYFVTPNGAHFRKDKKGLVTEMIEQLLDERNVYKKLEQDAEYGSVEAVKYHAHNVVLKEMANSSYGIFGDTDGRFFVKEIAEAITLSGQFVTKTTILFFIQEGLFVMGGDTDSLFVEMDRTYDVEQLLVKVAKLYDTVLKQFNVDTHYLNLEFEKQFKNFCVLAKKNYFGLLEEVDGKPVDHLPIREGDRGKRLYVKGIGVVKKSSTAYSKEILWDLLERIAYKEENMIEVFDWLWKEKEKFMNGTVEMNKLIIKKTLSRPTDSYHGEMMGKDGKFKYKKDGTKRMKAVPLHVKIAERMKEQKKEVYVGDLIEHIITNGKSPAEGVHISEFDGTYDKSYYWDKQVWSECERILNVVYTDIPFIVEAKKETKKTEILLHKQMIWKDFRIKRLKKDGVIQRIIKDPQEMLTLSETLEDGKDITV